MLWTALLAVQLQVPERVATGQEVKLRAVEDGRGVAGVEIRVAGPDRSVGTVTAPMAPLREGKGILFRDTEVLVLGTEGEWCRVITPAGGARTVACSALAQRPYGRPLGVTDASGELRTRGLAVAPGEVEVEAAGAVAKVIVIPYEYDVREAVAAGMGYRERRFVSGEEGPFTMQILEVDPAHRAVNLLPVRARDRMAGRETVQSMADRYGATAAVNAGYFVVTGPYAGAAAGVYQLDHRVLAGGGGRTALLFCEEEGFVEKLEMAVVNFRGRAVAAGGATLELAGLNRPRAVDELVLYLPQMGPRTLTEAGGLDAVLDADSRVTRLVEGNAEIPSDGRVLSGTGRAAGWLREHAPVGSRVSVEAALSPAERSCAAEDIVGAGPRLVRGGRPAVVSEGFAHEQVRHPRTAVGVTGRGTMLFVTLDGRQPRSAGMTLEELAEELVALGAVEAMNLDGGGSTEMVVAGQVKNSPSDRSQRPVGDGILVFSISDAESLRRCLERLAADAQVSEPLAGELVKKLEAGDREGFRRLVENGEMSTAARRILREAEVW